MPVPVGSAPALPAFATSDDLTARNIAIPAGVNAATILDAASEAIRDAASCPITQTTSTVELVLSTTDEALALPGGPVSSVAALSIDGVDIAQSVYTPTSYCWSPGWRLVGDSIYLTRVNTAIPAVATVTYTHGFASVPADIVDLTCSLAAMAFRQDGDYAGGGLDTSVRLGDYSEAQRPAVAGLSPSPIAIPDAVRARLRYRFGTTSAVIAVDR